jgi:RNAse (barnase) inhibitor barstar
MWETLIFLFISFYKYIKKYFTLKKYYTVADMDIVWHIFLLYKTCKDAETLPFN